MQIKHFLLAMGAILGETVAIAQSPAQLSLSSSATLQLVPISSPLSLAHPTSNPPSPVSSPIPSPECYGLKHSYIAEGTMDIIKNDFCRNVMQQRSRDSHSVGHQYNPGTPEEVDIGISWEERQDFEPTSNDCLEFLNKVIDCDRDFHNPMSWKGGGYIQEDGVVYHIFLPAPRPPAPESPYGYCLHKSGTHYHYFMMAGAGWASSDFGEKFKNNLEDCALLPRTFNFEYRLGDDGSEWNLTAYTAEWKDGCVLDAAFDAGAPRYMKYTML